MKTTIDFSLFRLASVCRALPATLGVSLRHKCGFRVVRPQAVNDSHLVPTSPWDFYDHRLEPCLHERGRAGAISSFEP